MLTDTERIDQMIAEAEKKKYTTWDERFQTYAEIKSDIGALCGGKMCSTYEMMIAKLAAALQI